MKEIIYFLAAYGISNIMAFGKPTQPIRWLARKGHKLLYELLTCMMCLPVYIGLIANLLGYSVTHDYFFTDLLHLNVGIFGLSYTWLDLIILILDMSITSASVWLIHTLQEKWER